MTIMTEERVSALLTLIKAVEDLGKEHAVQDNSPAEDRVFDALAKVWACGANAALQMPILLTV